MTTFQETDCVILRSTMTGLPYAHCTARNCSWAGPIRDTEAAAKRDAVRHQEAS